MELISMIVPCFNEEQALPHFYQAFTLLASDMASKVNFEVIFVNDGSKDDTINLIKSLHESDDRVKFISFSRNFGKEAAMLAGLKKAKGDYAVIIDADLQHPPEMIKTMYDYIQEGYDCVGAYRTSRTGEPKIRAFFADQFYKLVNKISDVKIVNGACDFRLITRPVIDSIISLKEYNRFTKGIFSFVGFDTKWLPYENTARVAGETTWSFWGLFKYSIEGIMAFSTFPLYFASLIGIIVCILSFLFIIFTLIKTIFYGESVAGYPTLVCIVTFLGGLQLFSTGILGQYIAKIYLESKNRPIYIIKEEN